MNGCVLCPFFVGFLFQSLRVPWLVFLERSCLVCLIAQCVVGKILNRDNTTRKRYLRMLSTLVMVLVVMRGSP